MWGVLFTTFLLLHTPSSAAGLLRDPYSVIVNHETGTILIESSLCSHSPDFVTVHGQAACRHVMRRCGSALMPFWHWQRIFKRDPVRLLYNLVGTVHRQRYLAAGVSIYRGLESNLEQHSMQISDRSLAFVASDSILDLMSLTYRSRPGLGLGLGLGSGSGSRSGSGSGPGSSLGFGVQLGSIWHPIPNTNPNPDPMEAPSGPQNLVQVWCSWRRWSN